MTFGVKDGSLTIENESKPSTTNSKPDGASKSPKKPSTILHPDLVMRSKGEIPDPESLALEEELPGWHGYVEWEQYPEKKQKVKEFMKKFDFPGVSVALT
jgi:sulfite oxidase